MDFSHCSKVVMQKIINYLYGGKIKLQDLSLTALMKLMNMASMLLLDELLAGTQFVLGFIPDSGVNFGSIPSYMLAEKFKLHKIQEARALQELEGYSSHF